MTRLLRLMPSHDRYGTIRCKLVDYSLEEREEDHQYEALSYTWGDSAHTEDILLNDSVFHVTKNLHAAFQHLRDRVFERVLWVDAICINQRDVKEKEVQIQSMDSVYGFARQVTVWLGKAGEGGDVALHHIRVAAKDDGQPNSVDQEGRDLVISLLSRDWFRRIWVGLDC